MREGCVEDRVREIKKKKERKRSKDPLPLFSYASSFDSPSPSHRVMTVPAVRPRAHDSKARNDRNGGDYGGTA